MLTLPIKRKWFDMICRGEKREEYREPTDYWKERLFRARGRAPENEIPDPFHLKIFPVQIRAGYRQDSPTACLMVTIQFGKYGVPEWGADPDKEYIIIRILSVEDACYRDIRLRGRSCTSRQRHRMHPCVWSRCWAGTRQWLK